MLHPDGVEVSLRPVGSSGEDAKYEELVLPLKADYDGRYMQCFIPHRDEGFEIVVEYHDRLDMHDASTMLVGIWFKTANATDEIPAHLLCHVAEHTTNIPGDENVFATEGGLWTRWFMGDGETNGTQLPHICDRTCNADTVSSSTPAEIHAHGR